MKSNFDFITFLKKQDKRIYIPIVIVIALLLILLLFDSGEKAEPIVDTTEAEMEALCSKIEGVGECEVMITYRDGEVFAVAVICDGAEQPKVREKIFDLITSIYGIGYNRVSIQPLAK